jgi:hypothetical protein
VVLALWAAVSMTWSPVAIDVSKLKDYGDIESLTALKLFLQLATYGAAVVALRGLSDAGARRAATVLAYGMVALAVIAALDSLTGAAIYQKLHMVTGEAIRPDLAMVKVSLSTYVLALLFWPAALILSRLSRPGLIWLLAAGTIVTSVICSSDACLVALAAGGLVWLLVYAFGQTAAKVLVGLVAAPFVLAPLAVLVGVETGFIAWLHRLVPASWDAAAEHLDLRRRPYPEPSVPGLGAGRQPHLRPGHPAAHPQRPTSAVAGAGRDRRGPGGRVLLLAGLWRRAA